MATYKEIQEYVKVKYGFAPKTCWIAHMKEKCSINVKMASNRQDSENRVWPCPESKENNILA